MFVITTFNCRSQHDSCQTDSINLILNKKIELQDDSTDSFWNFLNFSSKNKETKKCDDRQKFKFEVITYKGNKYYTFEYDLRDSKTQLVFNQSENNGSEFESFSNCTSKNSKKVIFATNGGIFKPDLEPEGLYIENGIVKYPLNTLSGFGNFYLQPNGVFYVTKWNTTGVITTNKFPAISKHIKFATQSGPMLLTDSIINPLFDRESKNKKLRSGVGAIHNYKMVFIISQNDVSFYDFASTFKDYYKVKNALYLDGVISKMYHPSISNKMPNGEFSIIISVHKK